MPFLIFDVKHENSFEVPVAAAEDLIARIDSDYPPYVKQIPSIYDVTDRKCYNGLDECLAYFTRYIDTTACTEPSVPVPSPRKQSHEEEIVDVIEPLSVEPPQETVVAETVVEEPKKKQTRRRKTSIAT